MKRRECLYAMRIRKASPGKYQRAWQAMRILRTFSTWDLMTTCEIEDSRSLHRYLGQLRKAGFIRSRKGAIHQPAIHALIRDSGPRCPAVVMNKQALWDLNTDEVYPL